MSYLEIFILALAFSVDACTVSFSYGILPLENPKRERLLLAVTTALFQAVMPIMGYFITSFAYDYIYVYAKLIVFAIFTILGIKFITEAFLNKKEKTLCIGFECLLLIGIGTSIDAFSGGISLRLSGNTILFPALIIGLTTFINSIAGFQIGKNVKHMPVKYMEVIAGIILVSLGLKALI